MVPDTVDVLDWTVKVCMPSRCFAPSRGWRYVSQLPHRAHGPSPSTAQDLFAWEQTSNHPGHVRTTEPACHPRFFFDAFGTAVHARPRLQAGAGVNPPGRLTFALRRSLPLKTKIRPKDCFVFPRRWIPCLSMGDFMFGVPRWGDAMADQLRWVLLADKCNLHALALPSSCRTIHSIGAAHLQGFIRPRFFAAAMNGTFTAKSLQITRHLGAKPSRHHKRANFIGGGDWRGSHDMQMHHNNQWYNEVSTHLRVNAQQPS